MQRGSESDNEPNKVEASSNLKQNVVSAFGFPDHLKSALHAWIDSVESRMSGGTDSTKSTGDDFQNMIDSVSKLEKRIAAVESALSDLHSALSSSPAPVGVQKAVADIDPVSKS